MVRAVFAANDEGDEGAGLLIDMTKVTRSTLADKKVPPCAFSARTHKNASINNRFVDLGRVLRRSPFLPPTRLDSMLQLATCFIGIYL